MAWTGSRNIDLEKLRTKIADIESCLLGNRTSKRWQTINTELVNAQETLRCLEEKRENTIPRQARDY